MEYTFRSANRADTGLILDFIRRLAEYERLLDAVTATEELLAEWLFDKQIGEVFFVMVEEKEVGFALYFHNFSTFQGKAGLYVEDVYIDPAYRGNGYGKAIFRELARIAVNRDCGRMDWVCLDWNQPSIDFYHSIGAKAMREWSTYRLEDQALTDLAREREGVA